MTTTKTNTNPAPVGGAVFRWLLGDEPRTITTKAGDRRTVLELRDPDRLSQSLVVWLDGEADDLARVSPGSAISLHVETVRSGRARGELVANVSREAVLTAFEIASAER